MICLQQTARSKLSKKLREVDFGEVVAFNEQTVLTGTEVILRFKLSDFIKLNTSQMSALGVHLKRRVLSIRFKNRLLFQFENVLLRMTIRKRWFWSSIMMLERQYLYQQRRTKTMMVVYWQGQHISYEDMYEYKKHQWVMPHLIKHVMLALRAKV